MRPSWPKNAFVYLLILVASIVLFSSFLAPGDSAREIPLNKVAELIKSGQVETLSFTSDGTLHITVADSSAANGTTTYTSRTETGIGLTETLINLGVTPDQLSGVGELVAARPSVWENWGIVLVQIVPLLLIGLFLVVMLRQAQSGNNQALSFGKSRARMFSGDRPTSTFDDVAGSDEASRSWRRWSSSSRTGQVHRPGRPHPQGRAVGGPSGHRQDPDGARRGRRGRRAFL